jgi:hypothetical protein
MYNVSLANGQKKKSTMVIFGLLLYNMEIFNDGMSSSA